MKRTVISRLLIVALGLLLGWEWPPAPVYAQTTDSITVDTAADDTNPATISLRDAVQDGNGKNIVFDASVGMSLTLSSEIAIPAGAVITIYLGGRTIQPSGAHRLFNVGDNAELIIYNGTLQGSGNTNPVAANGGVITSQGRLTLDRVNVTDGYTTDVFSGGAVYLTGGNGRLNARDSEIYGNQAKMGGGIYIDTNATATLTNTDVYNNTLATTTPANERLGAGIHSRNYLTIQGGAIHNNTGSYRGGGVYSVGGTLVIDRASLYQNTANLSPAASTYGEGGGVYAAGGGDVVFIGRSAIYDNQAHRGSAIATSARLDLYNSTIHGNAITADAGLSDEGGAVFVTGGAVLVSSFVTYSDNINATASGRTGGLWLDTGTTAYMKNSILAGNANGNCQLDGSMNDETGNIDGGNTCAFSPTNSQVSTDPILLAFTNGVRPLQETPTQSPAIDAVPNCTTSSQAASASVFATLNISYGSGSLVREDQRLAPRTPTSGNCDVGAYEAPPTTSAGVEIKVITPVGVDNVMVAENGTNDLTYTVKLLSEPADGTQVVISLAPDTQVEIEIDGTRTTNPGTTTLTFNQYNWAIPREVRVYAVQDVIQEVDPHSGLVTHDIDKTATDDPAYDALDGVSNLTVSIRDDDSKRFVSFQNAVTAGEPTTPFNFVITLDDSDDPLTPTDPAVVVTYRTRDASAVDGQDYDGVSATTINFTDTVKAENIRIDIINDGLEEPTETFIVEILSVSGAQIGTPSSVLGTILDDDTNVIGNDLTILPESVPTGKVGDLYQASFSATGGNPPYIFFINNQQAFIGDGWTFNSGTGVLSGTPTEVHTVTFTVVAVDSTSGNSLEGSRSYTVEFTLTGQPSGSEAEQAQLATATPISQADIASTSEANIRANLGPPVVEIDPNSEIERTYIYSGPASGATIINIAQAGRKYNVLGRYIMPGSRTEWYLIEYLIGGGDDPNIEGEQDAVTQNQSGWVSSDVMILSGYLPDLTEIGNPFDSVNQNDTGRTGRTPHKNNLYEYPTPNAALLLQFDEGRTFQVLGRTRLDGRNISNWLLVRLDHNGRVGWIKYTPFLEINGDLSDIPAY
jgi:hypothetical protein